MVAFEDLPQRIKQPLITFKDRMIEQYNPLGILLVGSFAKGYAGPHSDLDIYVIVEDQDWRERGNLWIDEIEIEYFINPVKQVHAYLDQEDRLLPHTADMLGTGLIVHQTDPVIGELIVKATEILDEGVDILKGVGLQLMQYNLDDIKKDLLDLREQPQSFAYQQTMWNAIDKCNIAMLRYYQSYAERTKVRMEQFNHLDSIYADLLERVVKSPFDSIQPIRLIEYVESKLGQRPEVWTLRGALIL